MPTIKRYANRKLYDTEARRYITLTGIAELIRKGVDIQVVDHATGEDLTAQTQAQIIFEHEKRGVSIGPRHVFTNLIQAGSERLNHLRSAITRSVMEVELERRMMMLIERGDVLEAEGLRLLEKLLAFDEPEALSAEPAPGEAEIEKALIARGVPSRAELQRLMQQVDALATELDQLKPR